LLFQSLTTRIIYKIGILAAIIIAFIISSFAILAYFQSQQTLLGNSINIAGKAMGLYCSALSISQDTSLRKIVRKSTSDLLDRIGTAQMEKDIEKNVMKVVDANKKEMEEDTGISSSMTDENIKEYLQQVIEERTKKS
jgi:hypothetical protein